jgi:hypothetical protein
VLSLAEEIVCYIQLVVLVQRWECIATENSILMLQLLELMLNGGVVLIVCGQMHTLLHDRYSYVMLQVEQVMHVLGHHSHADVEVSALEV